MEAELTINALKEKHEPMERVLEQSLRFWKTQQRRRGSALRDESEGAGQGDNAGKKMCLEKGREAKGYGSLGKVF